MCKILYFVQKHGERWLFQAQNVVQSVLLVKKHLAMAGTCDLENLPHLRQTTQGSTTIKYECSGVEGETQLTRKKVRRSEFKRQKHAANKMGVHGENVIVFL